MFFPYRLPSSSRITFLSVSTSMNDDKIGQDRGLFLTRLPPLPRSQETRRRGDLKVRDSVEVEEVNTYTPEGIERGMANGVMSVPTVFVEGEKKFVGFPFKEEDLVASIDTALGR